MESKEQKLTKLIREMMVTGCNSFYHQNMTNRCPFYNCKTRCDDCLLDEAIKLLDRLLVGKYEEE